MLKENILFLELNKSIDLEIRWVLNGITSGHQEEAYKRRRDKILFRR